MVPIEKRKAALEARLKELKERLESIESELESHNSKDWEELATERESDEVLEDLGEAGLEEIKAIEAALQRIEEGEYGYCVKCGTKISDERLDLLPYTPFCHACAQSVEKQA